MNEEWKNLDCLPNYYQVSNMGRVRSLDRIVNGKRLIGKVLKQQLSKKGYSRVSICCNGVKKTLQVHRLVGMAFIPNPTNEPQINHKNGIKTDNRVENLEWCDNLYNIRHSWMELGRRPPENCGKPKKKIAMIDKNTNEIIKVFDCIRQASIELCGSESFRRNIAKTANGCYGRKTCLGYKWEFV